MRGSAIPDPLIESQIQHVITRRQKLLKILKITLGALGALALLIALLFGHGDIPLEELKARYAPPPSSFLPMGGMEVHFRDEGADPEGTPIVLLHGTGSSLHTFEAWASELKKSNRIIRMDLPGYGLTGPFPDRDYSIENYLVFLKAFLDALGVEKCILGGNSLGGRIAWNFTARHPGMVDRLILIDASGYPTDPKSVPLAFRLARTPLVQNAFTFITPRFVVRSSVENVFADRMKVTPALVDRYFELSLREGNRQAFLDRFRAVEDPSAIEALKSIQQKTLILWGAQDELIPPENAHRFGRDLANDTLVILQGAGHVPMEEIPARSLEPVRSFIKIR